MSSNDESKMREIARDVKKESDGTGCTVFLVIAAAFALMYIWHPHPQAELEDWIRQMIREEIRAAKDLG